MEDGCSPGETVYDVMFDCIDYYCIKPVLIPLLRRHSPYVNHYVCVIGLIFLYKTGINTTTQEVLSMALGAE